MERREDPRPRRGRGAAVVLVVVLVAAVAVSGALLARERHLGPFALDPQADHVLGSRPLYTYPETRVAQAARQAAADGDTRRAEVFARLAEVPQGVWLTPDQHPPGQVGPFVSALTAAADAAGRLPVLVVYGIPERDCTGGYSSGGLAPEDYGPWVQEIATAAADAEEVVVVLEPDALASAIACGKVEGRVRQVRGAVESLREAGVTTYLDGGHSDWVPAGEIAPLLRRAGVGSVRGFATNVSNYQTDADEQAYGERLSELLGGAHYVIDRGRNGHGATPQWCNPPGRAFGQEPGYVDDGSHLDAYLWIKPPGESDGECGGGPPAGELWPERVMEMAAASGW